jgi:hypothetical protein
MKVWATCFLAVFVTETISKSKQRDILRRYRCRCHSSTYRLSPIIQRHSFGSRLFFSSRVELLEPGPESGNWSVVSREMGVSQQHFVIPNRNIALKLSEEPAEDNFGD